MYLILAMAGLLSTFIKVHKKQNFWYLLRFNVRVAFLLLIVTSFLNWDGSITSFNLKQARVTDMEYLIKLKNNSLQIKHYAENKEAVISPRYRRLLEEKFNKTDQELSERTWQELTYLNLINKEWDRP